MKPAEPKFRPEVAARKPVTRIACHAYLSAVVGEEVNQIYGHEW